MRRMMKELKGYRIEPVTYDDVEVVASLTAASWKAAYEGIVDAAYLNALTGARWSEVLPKRIADPTLHTALLRSGNTAIGTVWYGRSTTEGYLDDGEISALYLLPAYIGSGYGHPLMEFALDHLTRLGYSHVILDVFSANTRAIRFYEGFGLVTVKDDASFEVGDRHYPFHLMRKSLQDNSSSAP
jgi:ribosomal protein S18 acetylase RimI-like enzyme